MRGVCALLRTETKELNRVAELLGEVLGLHSELGCGVQERRMEKMAHGRRPPAKRRTPVAPSVVRD